jgi:hypothetical protein
VRKYIGVYNMRSFINKILEYPAGIIDIGLSHYQLIVIPLDRYF